MIDTVIFDLGNVLVKYDWKTNLESFGFSPEENAAIAAASYQNADWVEMDRGVLTIEEILTRFCSHAPQYTQDIRKVIASTANTIFSLPYTQELLRSLREKGRKLYFLSNYGDFYYQQTKDKLAFTKDMDGGIFSYEVQMVKPSRWIFEALLEKYQIDPARAVFLDDTLINVEAARKVGLSAIHFQTYEQACNELKALGVL